MFSGKPHIIQRPVIPSTGASLALWTLSNWEQDKNHSYPHTGSSLSGGSSTDSPAKKPLLLPFAHLFILSVLLIYNSTPLIYKFFKNSLWTGYNICLVPSLNNDNKVCTTCSFYICRTVANLPNSKYYLLTVSNFEGKANFKAKYIILEHGKLWEATQILSKVEFSHTKNWWTCLQKI